GENVLKWLELKSFSFHRQYIMEKPNPYYTRIRKWFLSDPSQISHDRPLHQTIDCFGTNVWILCNESWLDTQNQPISNKRSGTIQYRSYSSFPRVEALQKPQTVFPFVLSRRVWVCKQSNSIDSMT